VCALVDFELATTDLGEGIVCVSVTGELDLLAAPAVKHSLMDVINGGTNRLVVDLSDATFIDSTTLGVLVGANKRLRTREGVLVVACGTANIRTIFEVTLLDRVFDIVDSRETALSVLRRLADDVALGIASPTA
jgi:anti-sigma B factor antagonist